MAIPTYQSISAAASGTGTTITTNAPSGVSSGNLLILTVSAASAASVTTPSGWTQSHNAADPATSFVRCAIYHRIADGTGSDTPSVTLGSSVAYVAYILRFTDPAGSPYSTSTSNGGNATSTGSMAPFGSLSGGVVLVALNTVTGTGQTSDPTNWTLRASDSSVSVKARVYTQDASSAGTYGSESFSMGAGSFVSSGAAYLGGTAVTYDRSISDNLAATETPLRACTNLRTTFDNLGIKEGVFYKPKYKTFTPESLALRDTPIVLPVWGRGVSETFGFHDPTITRTTLYSRALNEQLGMTEVISRQATLLRVVSELLALRDTLGDIQRSGPDGTTWHRTLSENLAMLEAFNRTTQYQRTLIESLAMTESILRRSDVKRAMSENMAFQEQINRATVALRSIAESLGMSDTALLSLITHTSGATSRGFYRPGALDYQWDRPAWVDTENNRRGTSDEQVQ